jgi:hypothetical protein
MGGSLRGRRPALFFVRRPRIAEQAKARDRIYRMAGLGFTGLDPWRLL